MNHLGVEWVLGQDSMTLTIAIGTTLNLQFQVGTHPRAMNAIGS